MEIFIKDWLIPLATLGGILTAIILFVTKKDSNQDIDISTLNVTVKNMSGNVEKIMTNHLPHIQAKLEDVCEKVIRTEVKLDEHVKNHSKKR